jgi:hypothetical protein
MDERSISQYIAETFPGVDVVSPTGGPGAGDTFFIYDPDRNLPDRQRFPFATIVTKDYGDFDRASRLDRPGVFRLNIGVGRETYGALFGRSDAAEQGDHDFAALDRLMPHPVYAPQSWVSVLNPSPETFESVRPLLAEAYERAAARRTGRAADQA